MKIASLKINNYRTLESLDLTFPSSYAAICGANDSGKTNVVRAIRALMKEETLAPIRAFQDQEELSLKDDYPKWKDTEPARREIALKLTITLHKARDAGFYQFVAKQLSLAGSPETLDLALDVTYRAERAEPAVVVTAAGNEYSDLNAQEVLKKLQSSKSILFHNSTQVAPGFLFTGGSVGGYIREISGQHEILVGSMKRTVNRGLAKISKSQQAEFQDLLGRLQTKYKVGLSMPAFDLGYLPFSITLGERKFEVPLDDWGSGTKNRTLILLTLFRARQIGESEPSASKITPVLIVEEPESFLHPSAQAEFGRVLHDLAEEFQVQVIVTTHSPYLLSMQDPASNILLRRRTAYRQVRDTERVQTTGDDWMAPFGQALGLDAEAFKPWKAAILAGSDAILLVEGETDKEYFEMLRAQAHGANRLVAAGEIASYEGIGALSNTVLLRFVKNRYRKLFVTFDLDAAEKLERPLQALQLEKGKQYMPVGLNAPGKKNIEGLLPDSVTTAVYAANPALVQAATAGTREEQENARRSLKKLLLEEFKRAAEPGPEHFGHFYPLVRVINKALA
jgi:energy-coupling factor transporter ATP-binding protein EcfA2